MQSCVQAVNAANARTLPIMLATKALPEMETEERELLRRQSQAAAGTPLGAQYEKLGVSQRPVTLSLACVTPVTEQTQLLDAWNH